jgi:hypothetical protein
MKPPSDEAPRYEDHSNMTDWQIEHMFGRGEWFQMPKKFVCVMTIEEAYFLAYLINVSLSCKALEKNDGWFYHTYVQIENESFIPKWKQERLFRKLVKDKLLKTKIVGLPARRHMKIGYGRLGRMLTRNPPTNNAPPPVGTDQCPLAAADPQQLENTAAAKSQQQGDPPEQQLSTPDSQRHIVKRTKETRITQNNHRCETTIPRKQREDFSDVKLEDAGKTLAQQLYTLLSSKRKLTTSKGLKSWAGHFRELLKIRTVEEIQAALTWYEQHLDDMWTPQLRAASTFCNQFHRLEDAMQRQRQSQKQLRSSDRYSDSHRYSDSDRHINTSGGELNVKLGMCTERSDLQADASIHVHKRISDSDRPRHDKLSDGHFGRHAKSLPPDPSSAQATIKISKQSKRILRKLNNLRWPKGSDEQLPVAVQLASDEYQRFVDAYEHNRPNITDKELLIDLDWFFDNCFPDTEQFVLDWFESFHERVKDWKAWSGTIPLLRTDSKEFRRWGRELTSKYDHCGDMWDVMVREVVRPVLCK